jgi:tetratricopeptide (TPR) repeat protein
MMVCQRQFFLRLLMGMGLLTIMVGSFGCSGEDPSQLFQQGVDAMAAEKPDEAVIWFKKALQQEPEMALAHYKLGQIYHKKGEVKLAYAQLSKAVQQDPKMAEARKELIFLLVANRALEQAVKVCEQYLEINGEDEEVYLILGNSLAYLKKLDEAVKVLTVVNEKFPESQAAPTNLAKMLVAKGDVQDGRTMMENLAKENLDDIGMQISMAQMYEKLERYDLALLTLEALKGKYQDNPRPYYLLAQLSLKKNHLDQAKNVLLDAEQAGVMDSGLRRMHAMILHRQGDRANALRYFQKAVESATDATRQVNQMILVDYHSFLKNYKEAQEILETVIAEDDTKKGLKSKVVELFLAQGEFDQARSSVEALLKEDSGDARGYFLKGLMMMQEKDIVEAREQFSKAKELAPNAAENQFLYGLTFMEESQDISITEISEALKKNPNLLKARMALAELYAKKGDFQASLDELDKIIEKQAADSNARVLRISVLLKMGNPDAALADAQFLVEKQPEVAWHTFRLAEIYFFTKKYDKALPLYEKLQEEAPESAQILNRIVGINMLKKEHEQAMELAESFLAKYPDNGPAVMVKAKIYLSQGSLDLAENVLLPEADKGKEVAPLVMLAELYRTRNDAEKVVQYYRKALELVPDNVGIMMKLADFYLKSGEYPEAIASYEKVLQQKSDFLPAMNNLSFLYTEEGVNLDRALELANAVSRKLPDNPDVADTLGWIYVTKKVYSQAEPYLQIAIGAKPESPTIMYHMGMLRFGQKNRQDAEELLTSAIRKGLSGTELAKANEALAELGQLKEKFQKAVSEKEKGNASQAIELFEEILDSEGFSSDAAADLAMLYVEQNKDITKALELAQKAYDAQPANPHAADALGWVYYHQGSLLLAKQYIEQALVKDEDYGPAHVHLGAVYLKKEEPEAAKKEFEIAKSMNLSAADRKLVEKLLLEIER